MKRVALVVATILAISTLHGCAMYTARFSPPVAQETKVVYKENDFEMIERNLAGNYAYWSIQLGYLYPGMVEIPLGDPRLFSNALADMYAKSQQQAEGKPTQLVNWALDNHTLFLPIPFITVARKEVTFRADLIRYTK